MKQNENGIYWEDGEVEYTDDTSVLTYDEMREKYPMRWIGIKNAVNDGAQIISAIVVAFGDKNELLLLQVAGKLDYVFFTNEEKLLGASALSAGVYRN